MVFYILIDLNVENYQKTDHPELLFKNLIIFLNAYQKATNNSPLIIISQHKIIFDSSHHEITDILQIFKENSSDSSISLAQDFGFTLLQQKAKRILVINSVSQNSDNLLKCMFVVQKLKIRVDAISLVPCPVLNQICFSTNGRYSENAGIEFFLEMLGNLRVENVPHFGVLCICHEKEVLSGLVCPVCLSVYCKFVPICKKCKTKISFLK